MTITKELLESVLEESHLGEAVEVKGVDNYEWTLGKKPRGRGAWMFGLGPKNNHQKPDGTLWPNQVHSHNGSYGEAVAAAKKKARERGHTEIHVLT